ncbi:hypothetical protein BDE02_18G003300 [Populus trichocarpa]|nr:hypothetical protein BDE02_18G003300 [Populus trichocarpa]
MTCRQQVRAKLRFWKFKDILTFPAGKLSLATLYSLLLMQELLGNKSKNKLVQINAWLEEYYQEAQKCILERTGKEIQHRNQIMIKKCEGYNNYAMLKVKVPTCV